MLSSTSWGSRYEGLTRINSSKKLVFKAVNIFTKILNMVCGREYGIYHQYLGKSSRVCKDRAVKLQLVVGGMRPHIKQLAASKRWLVAKDMGVTEPTGSTAVF